MGEPMSDLFEERSVCYIDLLGFSGAVLSRSKSSGQINELADLLMDAEKLVKKYEESELTFQSLSDSIFISTKNSSINNLHNLINCCQDLFVFFALRGFLARGGIASGPCLISNSIVLGEPVVRAVKLEEQVADFPRVVLSRNTMDILIAGGSESFIEEHIVRGDDGPFWIDPFVLLFQLADKTDAAWKEATGSRKERLFSSRERRISQVNSITDFISENLYTLQENRRSYSFYKWIFDYYREKLQILAAKVGSDIRNPGLPT